MPEVSRESMDELDRALDKLDGKETDLEQYRRRLREESSRRSQAFTVKMRGIGKTALYVCESVGPQGTATRYRRSRDTARNEFHFAGEGWVVTRRTSDGPDSHTIVLDTNLTYRCNLPGLHQGEGDPAAGIDRHPYVTTTNLAASLEPMEFAWEVDVERLAWAVRNQGRPAA